MKSCHMRGVLFDKKTGMLVVFVTRILPSKWLHHKSSFIIATNLTYQIEHYKKTKTKYKQFRSRVFFGFLHFLLKAHQKT